MAAGSRTAVYTALGANSLVMVAKFGAFLLTGSGAMLSEGIHSLADVGNQALLAVGLKQAARPADDSHPMGYAREAPIWALISAVGIFFLGCGVTCYHAVHTWLHPQPMTQPGLGIGVLIFALVVEGAALAIAARALTKEAHKDGITLRAYVAEGDDPMGTAVLAEDSAAVLGVLIALGGIGLAQLTGDPRWDSVSSLLIGLLLGVVAIYLIRMNRSLLIGKAPPEAVQERLRRVLDNDPVVERIESFRAVVYGSDSLQLSADLEFDGEEVARRYVATLDLDDTWSKVHSAEDLERFLVDFGDHLIEVLGDEVDRIEERLREVDPDARDVDLEAN